MVSEIFSTVSVWRTILLNIGNRGSTILLILLNLAVAVTTLQLFKAETWIKFDLEFIYSRAK